VTSLSALSAFPWRIPRRFLPPLPLPATKPLIDVGQATPTGRSLTATRTAARAALPTVNAAMANTVSVVPCVAEIALSAGRVSPCPVPADPHGDVLLIGIPSMELAPLKGQTSPSTTARKGRVKRKKKSQKKPKKKQKQNPDHVL